MEMILSIEHDVESLPGLMIFHRLSLSVLELSQSRFKVISATSGAVGTNRLK